jgi:hypothetical protein
MGPKEENDLMGWAGVCVAAMLVLLLLSEIFG